MARPSKNALTIEELCRVAGVSVTAWKVHQRAGAPKPPRRRQDLNGWLVKYHAWRANTRRVAGREPGTADPEDARWTTERKKWLAKAAEQDFAARSGQLVDRDVVVAYAGRAALTVRNRLNDLVRKMAARLWNAPSREWIEEQLQDEVDAICSTYERGLLPPDKLLNDDDAARAGAGDQPELEASTEADGE